MVCWIGLDLVFRLDRIWIRFSLGVGLDLFGFRIGCLCLLSYGSVALTIQDYGGFLALETICSNHF